MCKNMNKLNENILLLTKCRKSRTIPIYCRIKRKEKHHQQQITKNIKKCLKLQQRQVFETKYLREKHFKQNLIFL